MEKYDIQRFITAQEQSYDGYKQALSEIQQGRKTSHWIWYIFPQIKGLGHSYMSNYYGISCLEEAQEYMSNEVLSARLREITNTLLSHKDKTSKEILGYIDDMKVRSCMTLFDMVSPNDIFNDVLFQFYESQRCDKTIWRLGFRDEKLKNQIKLSKLTITKDYSIMLSDYNLEVKLEPIVKAVYLLFLDHPEGIAFKCLPDYRKELADLYQKIKPYGLTDRAIRSIEDVTNPLLNSINEKCSRIRAAFLPLVDASLLDQYIIIGKSGEEKKIALPRDLVVWE